MFWAAAWNGHTAKSFQKCRLNTPPLTVGIVPNKKMTRMEEEETIKASNSRRQNGGSMSARGGARKMNAIICHRAVESSGPQTGLCSLWGIKVYLTAWFLITVDLVFASS